MANPSSPDERTPVGDRSFDADYYRHCCGKPYARTDEWLAIFDEMARRIVTDIAPRRVLDAGCALGLLVETLRGRGVEAFGLDVSSYAIEHVHEPVRRFCRHGSIVEEIGDRYDLILCIEVLEHVPARDADAAVANLCRHTDDVLFSSSPIDFREPTHVNVRPPEYWAERFAAEGFFRDVDFDATFVTPWAVRFRRSGEPVPRLVAAYERRLATLEAERAERRRYAVELFAEVNALRAAAHDLAAARDTIAHMERSWFWKARAVWQRLRHPRR